MPAAAAGFCFFVFFKAGLVVLSFLQDWGRAGDVSALGVCWHVPAQQEENFVFQLLSRLLHPELQRIEGHVSGDQPMSRCSVLIIIFVHFYNRSSNQAHTQTTQTNLSLLMN